MGGSIQYKTSATGKKVYYAVLSFPDGKRKWLKGKNKTDAKTILGENLREIDNGSYKEIPKKSFSEFAKIWVRDYADVEVKPSTLASYKDIIGRLLEPFFEGYLLSDITTGHLRTYVAGRMKKVSPKTVCNEIVVIKEMFNHAYEWGYLKHNPTKYLKRPKVDKPEIEILGPEEIERLLAVASKSYKVAFQMAVMTGLRAGELWGLQWQDIDWNSGRIHVRRSIYKKEFQTPKSPSAVRKVDMPPSLIHELKKWKLACPKNENDLVFPSPDGMISDHDNVVKRYFIPALTNAKVSRVSFHSLRHTNASLRIMAGQNIKYLSTQMGHASIQITMDRYGHLFNDGDFSRRQAELLESCLPSVRKSLENDPQKSKKESEPSSNSLISLGSGGRI